VSACGTATSSGTSSTPSTAPFANPNAGALRTYTTIEDLAKALSPTCPWTIKHNDATTPDSAWCEPESLDAALSHEASAQTVEELKNVLTQPNRACNWWAMVAFGYSLQRSSGREMYSAAGVTPSDLPTATTSVEMPAGMVQGGNCWTTYGTDDQGRHLAMASGGYLVPAPSGCPTASTSPTPSDSLAREPDDCSSSAVQFLATLVRKGLSGVSVETVDDRGPRLMDATTCMADYIAETDAAHVEKSLTSYLESLGYAMTGDPSKSSYVTIIVATAKGKPRVELELAAHDEAPSATAPFEVLIDNG
jgi:hypothetical protein